MPSGTERPGTHAPDVHGNTEEEEMWHTVSRGRGRPRLLPFQLSMKLEDAPPHVTVEGYTVRRGSDKDNTQEQFALLMELCDTEDNEKTPLSMKRELANLLRDNDMVDEEETCGDIHSASFNKFWIVFVEPGKKLLQLVNTTEVFMHGGAQDTGSVEADAVQQPEKSQVVMTIRLIDETAKEFREMRYDARPFNEHIHNPYNGWQKDKVVIQANSVEEFKEYMKELQMTEEEVQKNLLPNRKSYADIAASGKMRVLADKDKVMQLEKKLDKTIETPNSCAGRGRGILMYIDTEGSSRVRYRESAACIRQLIKEEWEDKVRVVDVFQGRTAHANQWRVRLEGLPDDFVRMLTPKEVKTRIQLPAVKLFTTWKGTKTTVRFRLANLYAMAWAKEKRMSWNEQRAIQRKVCTRIQRIYEEEQAKRPTHQPRQQTQRQWKGWHQTQHQHQATEPQQQQQHRQTTRQGAVDNTRSDTSTDSIMAEANMKMIHMLNEMNKTMMEMRKDMQSGRRDVQYQMEMMQKRQNSTANSATKNAADMMPGHPGHDE